MPITRSAFVDGNGKITAFEKDTRLHFLFVSENKENSSDKKYSETYGEAKGSGKAVSELDPDESKWSETEKKSAISFESGKGVVRYWEDAHARNSKLSVYGFTNVFASNPTGAPWYPKLDRTDKENNNGTETKDFPATWATYSDAVGTLVGSTAGKWVVGVYNGQIDANNYLIQNKTSILSKDDIAYSNNLSGDSYLYFNETSKLFTSGTAVFHRAMSMITINIYAGEGFDASQSNQFQFAAGQNIAMKGWNKKGYLNIKTGAWTDIETGEWSKIDNTNEDRESPNTGKPYLENGKYYYTLLAFVIPGNNLTASVDATSNPADALSFTIDGNKYDISKQQLYDAIKANSENCESGVVKEEYLTGNNTTKAGINYEFNITIGKTKIEKITAQIVDWKTVVADGITPSNARLTLQFKEEGTKQTGELNSDLYLIEDNYSGTDFMDNYQSFKWRTGYTTGAKHAITETTTESGTYTASWYWPSNKTFYHFRTISPEGTTIKTGSDDYVELSSAPLATMKDYIWGAPFLTSAPDKTVYSRTTGYCNHTGDEACNHTTTCTGGQLYYAIGPTESTINMILHHMMSQVFVDLETTDGDDKVNLDGAKVTLIDMATKGNLQMGNGLVAGQGTRQNVGMTSDHADAVATGDEKNQHPAYDFSYAVVPQALSYTDGGTTKHVGIQIETADGNLYIINDLSTIKKGTDAITGWDPGKKYYYKFTLKKTGIDHITATVVNWVNVEATNENITIQ